MQTEQDSVYKKGWNAFPLVGGNRQLRDKRKPICETCKHLTISHFCEKCLCFMPIKVYLKDAHCPIGKW